MATAAELSKRQFQHRIFVDLEHKLRATPWNSGASEAHGVLCGLACLGITGDTIRTRAYLFQLEAQEHVDIIEGMFGLVCRDLEDEDFGFDLMLPADDTTQIELAESISSWCQGFLLGVCHEQTDILNSENPAVREALNDIIEIGHIEIDPSLEEQNERDLSEIIEFLRVATQLIYDELQPHPQPQPQHSNTLN